jgi:predicted naringenin-chalcone synthase
MSAFVNRIATAVPPHDVHQRFLAMAPVLLAEERTRRAFSRMAGRCGIDHRWSILAPASAPPAASETVDRDGVYRLGAFPDTATRMGLFERHAPDLAMAALAALGIEAERGRITHLVLTTCTGLYAPGLDLDIVERAGLDRQVERTVIGFMGCQAAVNGLKFARHIVRSEPRARVLLVNLELCTLHLQETSDLERILSFLLFGDGCAASLVTADATGLALDGFRAVILPDSAGEITWRVGTSGFDMHLSGAVPHHLASGLPAALPDILQGRDVREVGLWAVHPGGRSVLDGVEGALGLEPGGLGDSRAVLRDHGNMSSPTVMFVLKRMLDRKDGRPGCAMAFGPGLSAETMTFRVAG